jgi:hypothetical protein
MLWFRHLLVVALLQLGVLGAITEAGAVPTGRSFSGESTRPDQFGSSYRRGTEQEQSSRNAGDFFFEEHSSNNPLHAKVGGYKCCEYLRPSENIGVRVKREAVEKALLSSFFDLPIRG